MAGIIAQILGAVGSAAGGVAAGSKGPGSSQLGGRAGAAAPYQPTASNFGPGAAGAPPGADLRLSDILGQQRQSPDDEMTLRMLMGSM